MAKPSAEMIEILRGIRTEIGAGMVMFPKSEAEHAHNNACERANTIIFNYIEGYGLFQMTRGSLGGALASEVSTGPQVAGESSGNSARPKGRARSNRKKGSSNETTSTS